MLNQATLYKLYVTQKMSSTSIAKRFGCSAHKINYWLKKYNIPKRSISDAIYAKHNPNGDPFTLPVIDTVEKGKLYGMGIGLYWGEGTKANKYAIRLGNSDPELIKTFMLFLTELYGVSRHDFKFGLQVFSDVHPEECLLYWTNALAVSSSQFYRIHVTPSGSIGTYRHKNTHGVVTLYYHNKRLRDIIVNALPR